MPDTKTPPTWREQVREAIHAAIMDAARAVFAEKGYHGATVEEIAARAEIGKGTVYNHIEGGKAGLFLALLDEHFDELQALAERALADEATPFRTRFARYSADFAAYFERHHDLFVLHLREVPRLLLEEGDAHTGRLQARRDRLVEALVPPLEAAMARGEVRRMPARLTAHLCFTALLGYLFQTCADARCRRRARPARPAKVAEHLTALLFDGLDARGSASKAA
jgi:AcrR family transcriptional regulator